MPGAGAGRGKRQAGCCDGRGGSAKAAAGRPAQPKGAVLWRLAGASPGSLLPWNQAHLAFGGVKYAMPGSSHPFHHLNLLQAEAAQQLAGQVERRHRAAQRAAKLAKQLQAAAGGAASKLPPGLGFEALVADMQLAQVREGTKGMLEALRAVAAEHPQLSLLQRVEIQAGLKLEAAAGGSHPGSAAAPPRSQCSIVSLRGSTCGSRPGSSTGRASLPATARGSPGPAAHASKSPGVRTVELQL